MTHHVRQDCPRRVGEPVVVFITAGVIDDMDHHQATLAQGGEAGGMGNDGSGAGVDVYRGEDDRVGPIS